MERTEQGEVDPLPIPLPPQRDGRHLVRPLAAPVPCVRPGTPRPTRALLWPRGVRRHGDDAACEWLEAHGVRLLPRAGEDRRDGAFEAPCPVRGKPPRGGLLGEAEIVRHRSLRVAQPHAAGAAI